MALLTGQGRNRRVLDGLIEALLQRTTLSGDEVCCLYSYAMVFSGELSIWFTSNCQAFAHCVCGLDAVCCQNAQLALCPSADIIRSLVLRLVFVAGA